MKEEKQRTLRQNRSAHLFFKHIADRLNESGLDKQAVLAKRVGIRWTETGVKEDLFKVLMKAMYHKESSTELSTKEFSDVIEMLCDVLAKDYGIVIDVPSIESLINQSRGVKRVSNSNK